MKPLSEMLAKAPITPQDLEVSISMHHFQLSHGLSHGLSLRLSLRLPFRLSLRLPLRLLRRPYTHTNTNTNTNTNTHTNICSQAAMRVFDKEGKGLSIGALQSKETEIRSRTHSIENEIR